MRNLTILEWNIHQQGRISKVIPMNILNYLIDIDIIVLLEINTKSINFSEFCNSLYLYGYSVYMTCYEECDYANDILIAVNSTRNIFVKKVSYYTAYNNSLKTDDIPENLLLDIEIDNKSYMIAGVRIKELKSKYSMRKKQMETLIEWTKDIKVPIFLVGDFNNLRENTTEKDWNINVLDSIKGQFIRKTPTKNHSWGVSYYPYEGKYDGYIKEDHLLISSNIKENEKIEVNYNWEYLKNNIGNCKLKDKNVWNQQKIEIPIGFPDHAIFTAKIPLS